jgi:hypothetical protein
MNAPAHGTATNAVVVLLDSLNRHLLGAYGAREFDTPNLDRFARRSVRFDAHFAGSLPCMPARHDLLCGALDFLWKPGSIEPGRSRSPWLQRAGVTTMLVSDHPHCPEWAARNYHCPQCLGLPARTRGRPVAHAPHRAGSARPSFGRGHTCDDSRGWFRGETISLGRARSQARPGSTSTRRTTSASSCWSTSSIRTSPSTRPSRTRRSTTRAGRAHI